MTARLTFSESEITNIVEAVMIRMAEKPAQAITDTKFDPDTIDKTLRELPEVKATLESVLSNLMATDTVDGRYVMDIFLDWMDTAYKAKTGMLTIRRDWFAPYSESEAEKIAQDNMFLQDPADKAQFLLQRSMRDEEQEDDLDLDFVDRKPFDPSPFEKSPWFKSKVVEHALTGAIAGGAISLMFSLLTIAALR